MAVSTLGTLRARLRARLGFAGVPSAGGVNQEALNSILQEAQVDLYMVHDWARLRRYTDQTLGHNQYLIDYPTNANPDRIKAISVLRDTVWSPPLLKGISPEMYTTQDVSDVPRRWEPYEQIELWPKSNGSYTVRVFYIMNLAEFAADDDETTIDSDLVFKVALGRAKAHYRQPDAQIYVAGAEAILASYKAKSWGKDVFAPDSYTEEPMPKPQVV